MNSKNLLHPRLRLPIAALLLGFVLPACARAQEKDTHTAKDSRSPILWQDPGDIASKNLFYGAAGEKHMPTLPVTFVSEEAGGISPKFEVKDASGDKWKAKLGQEAQSETVASRLLWAVGYFSNENFYYAELPVKDMPKLKRGEDFVSETGAVKGVRLQRHPSKKKEDWDWKNNPFLGTREFNGLRVMMALIRNWDLMADNNATFKDDSGNLVYEVTDVGASFGKSGPSYSDETAKNNLKSYSQGKFVSKVTADHVDFDFPKRPPLIFIFMPGSYFKEAHTRWLGKHIPREDVRWIAGLLSHLTHDQIRDAFRAGGYSAQEVDGFTQTVEKRIAELNKL